ncbi:MAG: ACP S-malonyltransferase, partial [Fibrobacterales bacterium]
PGQGSQYVGMGKVIAEENAEAAALLKQADDVLGFSLSDILFNGPEEELKKTENTQPALFVVSQMVMALLKQEGVAFDYFAGHSLGEYSAICAGGGISFEDGLRLVRKRGELMAAAGEVRPGAMAAVLGMEETDLVAALNEVSPEGKVVPANFNCPGQIVISGEVDAVTAAEKYLSELGKRVVVLPVSGAFHSPLMEYAKDDLAEAVTTVTFKEMSAPLIANVTSELVTSPESMKELLVQQLVSPVKWSQSMNCAVEAGVEQAVEVGAGKVLMGLMRKISRAVKVFPVESSTGFAKFKG